MLKKMWVTFLRRADFYLLGYITPFRPLKVKRHLGGPYRLHVQGWRVSQVKPAARFMLVSCMAYSSTLKTKAIIPPKCHLTFNKLQGLVSQETELIIITPAMTSDTTILFLVLEDPWSNIAPWTGYSDFSSVHTGKFLRPCHIPFQFFILQSSYHSTLCSLSC
jgi:hypothetical protein